MSKQCPPAPTASAVGPFPTLIQIVGRPGTGSLPSTIAPPDHPLFYVSSISELCCSFMNINWHDSFVQIQLLFRPVLVLLLISPAKFACQLLLRELFWLICWPFMLILHVSCSLESCFGSFIDLSCCVVHSLRLLFFFLHGGYILEFILVHS